MRDDNRYDDGDGGLGRLLAAANRELGGEEFAAAVMKVVRRSARRRRIRAWVIGGALATGVLLALGPLVEAATRVASAVRTLDWHGDAVADLSTAIQRYPMPVLAMLLVALGWPVVARWLAR